MLLSYLSCSAAALISYFCISIYFIIVTLVVVAFDNRLAFYRNEMNVAIDTGVIVICFVYRLYISECV